MSEISYLIGNHGKSESSLSSTGRFDRCIEGKNIGRSNETTPEQQSISEINSTFKTNKDKEIVIVMCDLKFKPYTWADGVTIQKQNNSFTITKKSITINKIINYAVNYFKKA